MKNERLFELLCEIDEELIDESEKVSVISNGKRNRNLTLKFLAACLCIILISAVIIGLARKPADSPTVYTSEGDAIMIENCETSQSPLYYGNPDLSGNVSNIDTSYAPERSPFAAVTVRLIEPLPDIYTFYDHSKIEYMILKMEVLEVLRGKNIPNEFYFLIPENYYTDFSIYDKFVLADIIQYSYDYSVMYNTTKDCSVTLDMVLFGNHGWGVQTSSGTYNTIAFDENGNFDSRLYESTESFSRATGWHNEEMRESIRKEIGTLTDTENRFRTYPLEGIENDFFVRTFSDWSEESQKALEYVKISKNGLFVPEVKNYTREYIFEDESVVFRRYFDGIATNETITIYPDKVEYTTASFDEAELSSKPPVRSAFTKICEDFEADKITPPHIEDYENLKNTVKGIFPWYAKTEEGVVGIIQVSWCYIGDYRSKLGLLFDDAYFIVTTKSETYAQIGRDELLEMFGDLETTYIYTGEYDNLGKVYKDRDCGYITIY